MTDLQHYENKNIELYINTVTGEAFASAKGYSRMGGQSYDTIKKRVKRLKDSGGLPEREIPTEQGLRWGTLIPEDIIIEWLPKDNPKMATQMMKLGVRMFLHKLAGYEVGSTAVEPKPQTQGDILLLMAQSFKDMEDRQKAIEASQELVKLKVETQSAQIQTVTERFAGLGNAIHTLSQFMGDMDTKEVKNMTEAQELNYICQNLGTVLAKFGYKDARKLPWRQLGVEMRSSYLRYDLNARIANARRVWEKEVEKWRKECQDFHLVLDAWADKVEAVECEYENWLAGGKKGEEPNNTLPPKPKRPTKPIRPTRPMVLERDGYLSEALQMVKCVVQFYVDAINSGQSYTEEGYESLEAVIDVEDILGGNIDV